MRVRPSGKRYGMERATEITPFYRAFISFMGKKDMVREVEKRKRVQDAHKILHPTSAFSVFLRKLCFLTIVYNLLSVPFRCAYELPLHPVWVVLDALTDIPPIVRIVCQFLMPFEQEGRRDIVSSRLKITEKYLKGGFLLDFVSILPLDFIFQDPWWRLVRLLMWKRCQHLQSDWEKAAKVNPMVYRMGKVVCLILLPTIHLVACWWYIIAREYSAGVPVTPIPVDFVALATNDTLSDDEVADTLGGLYEGLDSNSTEGYSRYAKNYVSSLYFSLVFLVGYNAGIPRNGAQGLFSVIVVFLGASVFALIIGYVGFILRELDNTQQTFRDKVDQVVRFMRYTELPKKTVTNVLHFYKHMWESRRGLEKLNVMDGIPQSLHRELLAYLHKDFVSKVPLFKGCDEFFLEEVSCCLQYVAVLPGYHVLRKGEIGKEMFFIHRGQVDVVSEDNSIVFASLSEGNFFGEVALVVPGAKRTASIVCKTFTELFVLNKTDFERLLDSYPETRKEILQVAVERGLIGQQK
ncbi:Cyclic nucleotide-gated cation channel [Diplonema papillatum]|nr:Cyclic nucleotide-gated cation channel [Diplonema papillatum]